MEKIFPIFSKIIEADNSLSMRPRLMKPTFLESGGSPDSFEPKMSLLGQIGKKQTGTLCKIFGRVSSPFSQFSVYFWSIFRPFSTFFRSIFSSTFSQLSVNFQSTFRQFFSHFSAYFQTIFSQNKSKIGRTFEGFSPFPDSFGHFKDTTKTL